MQGRLKKQKTARVKMAGLAAIVISSLALAGITLLYFWFQNKLTVVGEQRLFLESSIQSNLEVEQLAADLKKRSEVFGGLYNSRLPYSDIVYHLANLLPQEVLLKSLAFQSDAVALSGETSNYSSLAKFIKEGNATVREEKPAFPFSAVILEQAALDSQTGKITFSVDLKLVKPKSE